MRGKDERRTSRRCYRQNARTVKLAGAVLIILGVLVLFLCIPGWAWAALAGCALTAAGVVLISVSGR